MNFLKNSDNKKFLPVAVIFLIAVIACALFLMMPRTYPLAVIGKETRLFTVEFAETTQEQAKGLMFREELANDKGMLFTFPEGREVSFWMKNTLIPLDIIFIDASKKISFIHHKAQPHDESPISSNGKIIAVLEIPGGQANSQNIKIGDIIKTPLLPGKAE